MSHWPTASLPDVAEIIMGQSPPGDTYNETAVGLPFFQGKAEFGEVSPTPKKWCNSPKKIAEAGDILMSVRAPVGPTNLATTRCCIGRGLAAIRANQEMLDPAYLRFAMRHAEPKLASMGQGSTFAAIGRAELASTNFPLPPLPEQRRIVDLLSRAESIVRLRREAEKKAAELIPALFHDMFGDPATNPKGWVTSTLGEVAFVQGGLQVTAARADLPLERPYLRVANVHRSRLELGEIKHIRLTQAEFERTRLSQGDLLVVEGHGNVDEIGRVAIWDGSINDCVHQNHLIRARLNPDAVHPSYACEFLNSQSGRQFLLRSGKTTSGLNTISVSNVKAATILLPGIAHQRNFATQVESIRSIQSQQTAATTKAQATFDALLAKAFATNHATQVSI
jgi:type I restriction enzyme S subunit